MMRDGGHRQARHYGLARRGSVGWKQIGDGRLAGQEEDQADACRRRNRRPRRTV